MGRVHKNFPYKFTIKKSTIHRSVNIPFDSSHGNPSWVINPSLGGLCQNLFGVLSTLRMERFSEIMLKRDRNSKRWLHAIKQWVFWKFNLKVHFFSFFRIFLSVCLIHHQYGAMLFWEKNVKGFTWNGCLTYQACQVGELTQLQWRLTFKLLGITFSRSS